MDKKSTETISIVVLSFNRPEAIKRNVSELLELNTPNTEIIVIDNNSEIPVEEAIGSCSAKVKVIRLNENIGVEGRNVGIDAANSELVITLDDDVFGLTDQSISLLIRRFKNEQGIGAINFRVIDDCTEKQINWCHHRKLEEWGSRHFETYEISEGAVALRKSALSCSGLYAGFFFISHEGPDLALRLMNCFYEVVYDPDVVVRHAHAVEGRPGWRRYYYDARNAIWLAMRCYPLGVASRKVPVALGALFVYSIRDGYVTYFVKGFLDAFLDRKKALENPVVIRADVWEKYKRIERNNPSFWYMLKNRLFQKGVKI